MAGRRGTSYSCCILPPWWLTLRPGLKSSVFSSFFLSFVVLSFQSLPFDFFIIAASGLTSQEKNEALTKLFFSQTEDYQFYPLKTAWSSREPEDASVSFFIRFLSFKVHSLRNADFCLLETSLFDWTSAFCRNRNCVNLLYRISHIFPWKIILWG